MFLKSKGDPGISRRTYNSLTEEIDFPRKAAAYTAAPAIEVWTGQKHDETDTDLEDISYCSMTWYYQNNQLRDFRACD